MAQAALALRHICSGSGEDRTWLNSLGQLSRWMHPLASRSCAADS